MWFSNIFQLLLIIRYNKRIFFIEKLFNYWNYTSNNFLSSFNHERISYFEWCTISILREWRREREKERELWWTKTKKVKEKKLGFIDWAGILKSSERRATPLCWIAVVYASRFLRFDSQPAPLSSRLENARRPVDWREGGEREEWEEEVSHENRLRIKRLKVIWYLYRGNVAKFDKDRKDGEESFFSFFRVLIMEMKEEITNRDIGF